MLLCLFVCDARISLVFSVYDLGNDGFGYVAQNPSRSRHVSCPWCHVLMVGALHSHVLAHLPLICVNYPKERCLTLCVHAFTCARAPFGWGHYHAGTTPTSTPGPGTESSPILWACWAPWRGTSTAPSWWRSFKTGTKVSAVHGSCPAALFLPVLRLHARCVCGVQVHLLLPLGVVLT